MKIFSEFILVPILSYVGGIFCYYAYMRMTWGWRLLDFTHNLVYGAIFWIFILMPLYFIAIQFIKKRFDSGKALLYPLSCIIVSCILSIIVIIIWVDHNIFSRFSVLIYFPFITTGLIFGVGNWFAEKFNSK